ncbi:MAG: hypothetical protein ACK4WC_06480 [Rubrimonas sp.]
MPARRIRFKAPLTALLLCAVGAGCGGPQVFQPFAETEGSGVAGAPYPDLAEVHAYARGMRPPPDAGDGAAIARDLALQAALAQAESERVSGPVFAVEPLRRDADAVRRGPGF